MSKFILAVFFLVTAICSASLLISSGLSWTPLSEQGALLILEAFATPTITKDGSNNVTQWNDQSPAANHALTATGTKPVWVSAAGPNGTDVIRFNNSELKFGASANTVILNSTRAHTMYFVHKFTSFHPTQSNTFFCSKDQTNKVPCIAFRNNTTAFEFTGDTTWGSYGWSQSSDTTTFHKMVFTYNGSGSTTSGNFAAYYDTTLLTIGTVGNGGGSNSMLGNYLNGTDNNYSWNADASAVYIYDHVLSAATLANFNKYLKAKLNL